MKAIRRFAPVLVAFTILVASVCATWSQWSWQAQKNSSSDARDLSEIIDGIFDNAHSLAINASTHLGEPCTDDVIRSLSRLTASTDKVRSVNIIQENEWFCSSLEGRQSLNIITENTHATKTAIEFVHRQNTNMYMIYFPFDKRVIATALFKTSIDQIISDFASKNNIDAKILFSSDNAEADSIYSSSDYPFSIAITSNKDIVDFLDENRYLLTLLFILAFSVYYLLIHNARMTPQRTIQKGIDNSEFIPFYQPVVKISDGALIGAEVLVRWQNPSLGIIYPNEFIQTAENSGLISAMTTGLMKTISQDMRKMEENIPTEFHIAINIAPISLMDDGFIAHTQHFVRAMHKIGINVILEITERQQGDISKEVLTTLKATGARLALDDFGTGYSNFSVIENTGPEFIKIDKMFIDSLGKGGVNESIVHNIVQLSRTTHIPLIAEGVETQIQWDILKEMGVEYAQGYLFGKPMTLHDFIKYQSQ